MPAKKAAPRSMKAPKEGKFVVEFEEKIAIVTVAAVLVVMLLYSAIASSISSSTAYASAGMAKLPPGTGGSGGSITPAPKGPITCGSTITTSTVLTQDLLNCPDDGLIIGADSITLDCNGHTIDATHNPSAYEQLGISVSKRKDFTIKNCVIKDFEMGVSLSEAVNGKVLNNQIISTTPEEEDLVFIGIEIKAGGSHTISGNMIRGITTFEFGIYLKDATTNNVLSGNTLQGLYTGIIAEETVSYNTLENNIITTSDLYEPSCIALGGDYNKIKNNVASCNYLGINIDGDHNEITGNTANDHMRIGIILIGDYNIVRNNIANSNEVGFQLVRDSKYNIISGNTMGRNEKYGIYLGNIGVFGTPAQNTIWNNIIVSNSVANAYEDAQVTGNAWDDGTIGNQWGDWSSNPGYPETYIIFGEGNGVDHHPIP